jgi:hypothetical protein
MSRPVQVNCGKDSSCSTTSSGTTIAVAIAAIRLVLISDRIIVCTGSFGGDMLTWSLNISRKALDMA